MMIEAVIFDWMNTLYDRQVGVYPFTAKVLEYLKPKYKIGLVTLALEGENKRINEIKDSGLEKYFDAMIIKMQKTEIEFSECLKLLEKNPNQTAVVDDQLSKVMMARRLGCRGYWVTNDSTSPQLNIVKVNSVEVFLSQDL